MMFAYECEGDDQQNKDDEYPPPWFFDWPEDEKVLIVFDESGVFIVEVKTNEH